MSKLKKFSIYCGSTLTDTAMIFSKITRIRPLVLLIRIVLWCKWLLNSVAITNKMQLG